MLTIRRIGAGLGLHQSHRLWFLQPTLQVVQFALRGVVGGGDGRAATEIEMGYQQQMVVAVIKHQHGVEAPKLDVGQAKAVRWAGRQRLHHAHRVVAQVADQAAAEAGQPRQVRRAEATHVGTDRRIGIIRQRLG